MCAKITAARGGLVQLVYTIPKSNQIQIMLENFIYLFGYFTFVCI